VVSRRRGTGTGWLRNWPCCERWDSTGVAHAAGLVSCRPLRSRLCGQEFDEVNSAHRSVTRSRDELEDRLQLKERSLKQLTDDLHLANNVRRVAAIVVVTTTVPADLTVTVTLAVACDCDCDCDCTCGSDSDCDADSGLCLHLWSC
jgi:hypothetical protein